jgi:hypothetical protein
LGRDVEDEYVEVMEGGGPQLKQLRAAMGPDRHGHHRPEI